ncbi:hypothetical protein R6Q59_015651 [Mikania micrantha]
MSNEEVSSSHHAITIQEISGVETKPKLVNQSFQNLFDRIEKSKDDYVFSPICVVPTRLREASPSSFTPRVLVSIGPLHKGYKSLKSMENKKLTMLSRLLHDVGSPRETFETCMQKAMDSIKKIRAYYYGKEIMSTDVDLALMMIVDGCFIPKFR